MNCCEMNIRDHTNAFLDLNGVPYLLGEYLDKREFRQVDRSWIKSEINIDQTESMRALVDINIDDIGKRASDGLPAIVGNNTKQQNILQMTSTHANSLDHKFDVIKKGIIVRINYQVENQRTRQVIRTMCEDLRISDRSYFFDINPRDVNDNAIIINFCNSMVSTINHFTYGTDRMLFRITNIQLLYECMKREIKRPPNNYQSSYPINEFLGMDGFGEMDYYQYQKNMQNRQVIGIPGVSDYDYGDESISAISPPGWSMFNRFYHFDDMGSNIVLHHQEIYDRNSRVYLLPCGTIQVNRSFMINPGHRIVFKLSIWKNDLTVVNDTTELAKAIGAQCIDTQYPTVPPICHPPCPPPYPMPCPPIQPDYDSLIKILHENYKTEKFQNKILFNLSKSIKEIKDELYDIINPTDPPVDPPVDPPDPGDCDCDCEAMTNEEIENILESLGF